MRRVEVLAVGKLKDRHVRALCDDYFRRCSQLLRVNERELRDQRELHAAIPSRSTLVVLDERGRQLTSRAFAQQLERWLESAGSAIVFAIGGAEGHDAALRERADDVISLGKMTFAHRLVRLLLAEQLYRAVSIIGGSPYHRE